MVSGTETPMLYSRLLDPSLGQHARLLAHSCRSSYLTMLSCQATGSTRKATRFMSTYWTQRLDCLCECPHQSSGAMLYVLVRPSFNCVLVHFLLFSLAKFGLRDSSIRICATRFCIKFRKKLTIFENNSTDKTAVAELLFLPLIDQPSSYLPLMDIASCAHSRSDRTPENSITGSPSWTLPWVNSQVSSELSWITSTMYHLRRATQTPRRRGGVKGGGQCGRGTA